eukprot:1021171-Amphidinium_carterae.5
MAKQRRWEGQKLEQRLLQNHLIPKRVSSCSSRKIEWFIVRSWYMVQVHSWSNYQCLRIAKLWAPEVFSAIHPDRPRKWSKMKGVEAGKRGQAKKVDPAVVHKLAPCLCLHKALLSQSTCVWLFSTRLWLKRAWTCVYKGSVEPHHLETNNAWLPTSLSTTSKLQVHFH